MVALELEGLTKEWPAMKIRVDLKVEAGSLMALAGPSGCGKSTVLRMIAGLCHPDSGLVRIGGNNVTALSPRDREVGMVFQDYALFPHLDVLSNVAYGLTIRGVPRKTREAQAIDILESVGMHSFSKRRPHELSGGERQRVALARTIATRPRVVLFDEPLSSLDTVLRKHLRSEISTHQKRFGLTAIYVTHDLEEAMAMADNIAVMDGGSILQCTTPIELWSKPASEAVARFLGNGPCLPILRFESSGKELVAITATGRFGFQAGIVRSWGQSIEHLMDIESSATTLSPNMANACIFFERTLARPVSYEEFIHLNLQCGYGLFSATCIRTDFAGDAIDCLMEAGQKNISLRLAPENAPAQGEHVHFIVKTEKIRIVPAD
ncbi:MAG: hypothetical protein A3J97_07725 [Spirochaetes bacterium RIFOXYC1_FULL_54_7]|nr:MAG: hypothetical protein A3J97_07725 [Spirochaetes bacterium RIFOXYC1_FULL_54_7]